MVNISCESGGGAAPSHPVHQSILQSWATAAAAAAAGHGDTVTFWSKNVPFKPFRPQLLQALSSSGAIRDFSVLLEEASTGAQQGFELGTLALWLPLLLSQSHTQRG